MEPILHPRGGTMHLDTAASDEREVKVEIRANSQRVEVTIPGVNILV